MSSLTMKQLLEAGSHFGHQTRRWNPKMKKFIFGSRNNIYVIDLQKTLQKFRIAYDFVKDFSSRGGEILFVGTKKQAKDTILEEARRCGTHYINNRWLGGMLTNFYTIKKRIDRLVEIEEMKENGVFEMLPKKEVLRLEKERAKLEHSLGGIRNMEKPPGAIFIVDIKKEKIALKEAQKLKIPIVAIVDTNCDPDNIDYVIPSNDDAIRSIRLIVTNIADAVLEGRKVYEQKIQEQQAIKKDEETVEEAVVGEEIVDSGDEEQTEEIQE